MSRKGCIFTLVALSLACSSPKERAIQEARAELDQRDWAAAVERLTPFKDESDARIAYYLGQAWLGQSLWEMAAVAFGQAVRLDSSFADSVVKSYAQRARVLSKVDESQAFQLYNQALGFGELSGEDYIRLADIYYARGEYLGAIEPYAAGLAQLAISQSGTRAQAYEHLVNCQLKIEDWDGASASARAGLSEGHFLLSPLLGEASYHQAQARFRAKDLEGAKESVQVLLSLQTPTLLIDDGYYLLGEICLELKDYDQAEAAYRSVLRADPSFSRETRERARSRLDLISKLRGNR
jgi:tetratricopeptide (TPR) repeat protein